MPYIDNWNQKYSDKGLVTVGIHSPEFTFEKNFTNVKDAVQRFGINYPVILDSDLGTWNAYQNNYWPRYYLIDAQGYIRYDHIGEGDYDQIEKSIQSLLAERAALMGAKEINLNTQPTGRRSLEGSVSGTPIDSQDTLSFSVLTGVRSMNEIFPLERAAEAYDHMMSGKARFRCVLTTGN
jgi:hypothetical protein